jgi:predicted MPP superfamily phosphohydrolase
LDQWDPRLDGVTVLHLSDLHLRSGPSHVDVLLRKALAVPADITVITGDFVAKPKDLEHAARVLEACAGGRRVFAILGNHEHAEYGLSIPLIQEWKVLRRPDTAAVSRRLEQAGLTMLRNRSVTLSWNGAPLALAGVDDLFNHAADLDKALAGLDGLPTVLLCHSPDVLAESARRRIPLTLSGHTHGGQMRLPFLPPLTTGTRYRMERPCGVLRRGQATMHVSPGLGLSFPPLRLLVRPEATVLELRSRPPAPPMA